jgi:hypothetical protein
MHRIHALFPSCFKPAPLHKERQHGIYQQMFNSSLESHLATLHLSPSVQQLIDLQRSRLASITIPTNVSSEEQTVLKRASDESFVSSFRLVSLMGAALALRSAN